ncbi:replication initiator protein [Microvirus sp.]|nr:replication initiator protein [Microvirus sp.]
MCKSPLKIPTRKRQFSYTHDPLYYTVPCGHCEECQRFMRMMWALRSYYELRDTIDRNHGFCLFATLTYNNEHLPTFPAGYPMAGKPCFDKTHVKKFLYLLRTRLFRLLGKRVTFKYILTSEYGGETHRPHYHMLFYVHGDYKLRWQFRKMVRDLWSNYYNYGFVDFGKRNYGFVTSWRACNYVTKYVVKDYEFHKDVPRKADLQKAVADAHMYDTGEVLSPEEALQTYLDYKNRYFPFHLQSMGFGLAIKDYVTDDMLLNGTIPMPTKKGMKNFPAPPYIIRKVYYDQHKDGTYTLNDKGRFYKMHNYNDMLQRVAVNIESFHRLVSVPQNVITIYKAHPEFQDSPEKTVLAFNRFFAKYTYIEFAKYLLEKRYYIKFDLTFGTTINHTYESHVMREVDELTAEYAHQVSSTMCERKVREKYEQFTHANSHPFEHFAQLYDRVKCVYGELLYNAYLISVKESNKLKYAHKQ